MKQSQNKELPTARYEKVASFPSKWDRGHHCVIAERQWYFSHILPENQEESHTGLQRPAGSKSWLHNTNKSGKENGFEKRQPPIPGDMMCPAGKCWKRKGSSEGGKEFPASGHPDAPLTDEAKARGCAAIYSQPIGKEKWQTLSRNSKRTTRKSKTWRKKLEKQARSL